MEASIATRPAPPVERQPGGPRKGAVESSATWHLSDRVGLVVCWALGILFCAIAAAIVVYLLLQGIKYVRPWMLWTPAETAFTESKTGGFSDALIGTPVSGNAAA